MATESYKSNEDSLEADLRALIDSWDFTAPGEQQSLGRDVVGEIAAGIHDRTVAEKKDAHGEPLKPNEKRYAARKAREFQSFQPLVRSGQLLSLDSLVGRVDVTPDKITMNYGTNSAPSRVFGPSGNLRQNEPTDRQKAEWNSEERPFYALDERIVDERVLPAVAESLDKHFAREPK